MSVDVERYLEMVSQPWGQMFYHLALAQLSETTGDALDFGSGLGVMACQLARSRKVLAIEPDERMVAHRRREGEYEQMLGGVERLEQLERQGRKFGLIVCHNVLEYVPDRDAVVSRLASLLEDGASLSIVRNHRLGKVMQAAVFAGDPAEALRLYRGGAAHTVTMRRSPDEYSGEALLELARANGLRHVWTRGIRSFYGLGDNTVKHTEAWQRDMFELERAVQDDPEFRATAMYHHVLFRKDVS